MNAIPTELRDLAQWVIWRRETREGKPTKVPYRATGQGHAAVDNPATWASFEQAIQASAKADGIGFVFTAADPFVGVDLDNCCTDGRLHPKAAEVLLRLDSYSEFSQSGTGAHVIVRGQLNGTRNRTGKAPWGGGLEVYERGGFFCMTGDLIAGAPTSIEPRQAELDQVLEAVLPPSRPSAAAPVRPTVPALPDDAELLERARSARNGATFEGLWRGELNGHASRSEADLAFCSLLAFWAGPDPARIDRLFRSSGLMRDKWDTPAVNPLMGRRQSPVRSKGALSSSSRGSPPGRLLPLPGFPPFPPFPPRLIRGQSRQPRTAEGAGAGAVLPRQAQAAQERPRAP